MLGNRGRLITIGLIVYMLIGALALWINGGLRYTDYNPSFVVTATEESINDIASFPGAVKVDRTEYKVYFPPELQAETLGRLNNYTEANDISNENTLISYFEDPITLFISPGISWISGGAILILIYMFYRRIFQRLDRDDRNRIVFSNIVGILLMIVTLIGTISIISTSISISVEVIMGVILAVFINIVSLYMAFEIYLQQYQYTRVDFAIAKVMDIFNSNLRNLPLALVILAVFSILGYGIGWGLEAVAFSLMAFVGFHSLQRFTVVGYKLWGVEWRKLAGPTNRLRAKQLLSRKANKTTAKQVSSKSSSKPSAKKRRQKKRKKKRTKK